jgi:hypothetical protein
MRSKYVNNNALCEEKAAGGSILELVDESEGTFTERGSRILLSIFLSLSDREISGG